MLSSYSPMYFDMNTNHASPSANLSIIIIATVVAYSSKYDFKLISLYN